MSTKRWPLRCPAQCSPLHLHLSYRVTPLGIRTRGTRVSWRSACWLKWIHVGKKHETWRMCWCRCATGAFKGAKEELCPVVQVTIFPQAGRAFPRVFLSIEHHFFYYKGLSILVLLFPALVFFLHFFQSFFLFCLIFSLLFSSFLFFSPRSPFLWRLHSEPSSLFLGGTLHFLTKVPCWNLTSMSALRCLPFLGKSVNNIN